MLRVFVAAVLMSCASAALAADFDRNLAAAQNGDFKAALAEWTPLAEDGDAKAQYNIGWMHWRGDGVEQSDQAAAGWFLRAARQGLKEAQSQIGYMLANGLGAETDLRAAIRWTQAAADQGDQNGIANVAPIQNALGWAYLGGDSGVSKDVALACMWFQFATVSGHSEASQLVDGVCGSLSPEETERLEKVTEVCAGSAFSSCE